MSSATVHIAPDDDRPQYLPAIHEFPLLSKAEELNSAPSKLHNLNRRNSGVPVEINV